MRWENPSRRCCIILSYSISKSGIIVWNNCFIKNALKRAWYNGPYTMMAKAMKTLELYYLMIQF